MYGTLARALSGRKIRYDRQSYTATVDGCIAGVGKTIRIQSIALHYTLSVPAETREATIRALHIHPKGCPAHASVAGAIEVTWDATVHVGDEILTLSSSDQTGEQTETA